MLFEKKQGLQERKCLRKGLGADSQIAGEALLGKTFGKRQKIQNVPHSPNANLLRGKGSSLLPSAFQFPAGKGGGTAKSLHQQNVLFHDKPPDKIIRYLTNLSITEHRPSVKKKSMPLTLTRSGSYAIVKILFALHAIYSTN